MISKKICVLLLLVPGIALGTESESQAKARQLSTQIVALEIVTAGLRSRQEKAAREADVAARNADILAAIDGHVIAKMIQSGELRTCTHCDSQRESRNSKL